MVKVKGKGHAHDIAPLVKEHHCKSAQVCHTVIPAHPYIYPRMEWTIPALAFPAKAGPHLPILERWEAELA